MSVPVHVLPTPPTQLFINVPRKAVDIGPKGLDPYHPHGGPAAVLGLGLV